jgi:hypothetical protein
LLQTEAALFQREFSLGDVQLRGGDFSFGWSFLCLLQCLLRVEDGRFCTNGVVIAKAGCGEVIFPLPI